VSLERRAPSSARPITPTREFWYDRPIVYRCYDADGRLIYIGCTIDPAGRFHQHEIDTWWWSELLAKVRISLYPTRLAALAAEKQAIKAEDPAFNVNYTGRWLRQLWTDDDWDAYGAWRSRRAVESGARWRYAAS
jgi:hypothetical protein